MNINIEFTPVMLLLIPGIAGFLQGIKQTVWAGKFTAFFPLLSTALGIAGCYAARQPNPVVSGIAVGMGASWGFDIFKGIGSKPLAVVMLLCVLGFSGCVPGPRPIQMDPVIQAHVELAAGTTAEFNRRCKEGDAEACKLGCNLADETLQIIVDGLHNELKPEGVNYE